MKEFTVPFKKVDNPVNPAMAKKMLVENKAKAKLLIVEKKIAKKLGVEMDSRAEEVEVLPDITKEEELDMNRILKTLEKKQLIKCAETQRLRKERMEQREAMKAAFEGMSTKEAARIMKQRKLEEEKAMKLERKARMAEKKREREEKYKQKMLIEAKK